MTLGWIALLRALRTRALKCPGCGSTRLRPSREPYEGYFARKLDLRAYRCRTCYRHCGIPARIVQEHTVAEDGEPEPPPPRGLFSFMQGMPPCPHCGNRKVRLAASQPEGLIAWVTRRRLYRCNGCHHRYLFVHWRRAMVDGVLVLMLVAGLAGSVVMATRVVTGKPVFQGAKVRGRR